MQFFQFIKMDNRDGMILSLYDSGLTLREIIDEGDYNQKAYIHMNRRKINEMIKNWRQYNGIKSTKNPCNNGGITSMYNGVALPSKKTKRRYGGLVIASVER